jgi:hypothetical protein
MSPTPRRPRRREENETMHGSSTIGSLVVLTLTLVSDAASRGMLTERSWRAHQSLKDTVVDCLGGDEPLLEDISAPSGARKRISIAIEQSFQHREEIKGLARSLIEALKSDVLRGSLGISLRKLQVLQAYLDEAS